MANSGMRMVHNHDRSAKRAVCSSQTSEITLASSARLPACNARIKRFRPSKNVADRGQRNCRLHETSHIFVSKHIHCEKL